MKPLLVISSSPGGSPADNVLTFLKIVVAIKSGVNVNGHVHSTAAEAARAAAAAAPDGHTMLFSAATSTVSPGAFKEVAQIAEDANGIHGLLVPAQTPPDVVARLRAFVQAGMRDKMFRDALARASMKPGRDTTQDMGSLATSQPGASTQRASAPQTQPTPPQVLSQAPAGQSTEMDIGNGRKMTVTTVVPAEIGAVCGRKLWYAGISPTEYRMFNCDGTGTYVNACPPGQNSGSFDWGFVLMPPAKTRANVRSFSEWGWGEPTSSKAAEIVMRFKGGCADGEVFGGILGVNSGKVVQGFGNGFGEK